jgi:hypothetical protein
MTPKSPSHSGSGGTGGLSQSGRFSHLLCVETVPEMGLDVKLCATEEERAALAAQCGLVAVQAFEADFHVGKRGFGGVKVTGTVEALVTQTCVVTLEPFDAAVRADIDVDFAPGGESPSEATRPERESWGGGGAISLSGEGPPDPIVDGHIDLGALAAEFLVLNLDIYPRKPGAVFEEVQAAGERNDSPFAVLRRRP